MAGNQISKKNKNLISQPEGRSLKIARDQKTSSFANWKEDSISYTSKSGWRSSLKSLSKSPRQVQSL